MATPIKLKNSQVKDKAPQPSDLITGEIAVNTHADSPAIYLKDTAGAVVKIAGAGAIGGTPATETSAGIAELATQAETDAGTDDATIVTPLKLATKLSTAGTGATGDFGYWNRTGTVVSPTNTGDDIVTTGRIGAGTATPAFQLEVKGESRIEVANTNAYTSTSTGPALSLYNPEKLEKSFTGLRLVTGTTGNNASGSVYAVGTGNGDGALAFLTRDNLSGEKEKMRLDHAGVLTLGDGTTNAVTLDPGSTGSPLVRDSLGRVLVGTSTAVAGSAALLQATTTINLAGVAVYADNTAAKAGGLVDGDVYRTATGQLMIVYT